MPVRGIRGAGVAAANTADAIHAATLELLRAMIEANPGLRPEDVASAFFTMPTELDAAFPALAARTLPGWTAVPLLCSREIPVPNALPGVIRVLLLWNTQRSQDEVRHVYLGETTRLRPDVEVADVPSGAGEREAPRPPGSAEE